MTTLIPAAILLISLGSSAGVSRSAPAPQQGRAEVRPFQNETSEASAMSSLLGAINAASRGEDPWERAARTVFYVPGADFPGSAMVRAVTEDMAIMCRIFDKSVTWAFRTAPGQVGSTIQFGGSGSVLLVDDRPSTQGLYLQGYGAVFFIPVDFPLAPSGREQTAVESEPPTDPVWSQTANELRGVPPERPDAAGPRYDAQRVENLKKAVIGVLRHASNLRTDRTRKPQDVIDVVVCSRMSRTADREWMLVRPDAPPQTAAGAGSAPEGPVVLILRTTKIDVDALANGELTQEQFAARVRVLKSWTIPGRDATGTGVSGSDLLLPRRTRR